MTTQDHRDDTRRALAAGIAHDVPRNRPQPNGKTVLVIGAGGHQLLGGLGRALFWGNFAGLCNAAACLGLYLGLTAGR